jgi:3-phenylpropionate/trans-cinnamate dioxygenase ferredoxin reductase subunit
LPNTIVIVGAGHAAGQIVATLKQQKFDGRIVLLGEESYLPYQRPPLSKKFLAGEMPAERLYVKPATFYDSANIDVYLRTRVTAIDRKGHRVRTSDGQEIAYDKLILATGSRVRKLPGHDHPRGLHYLRNIDDVLAIQADLEGARNVVIIGAGYIGLEVAAVTRTLGKEVTVIEMADRVMSRVVSPEVSAFYEQEHRSHGVLLLPGTGLAGVDADERVQSVRTSDGQILPADIVLVGVGIEPNTELASAADLAVDNGIVVDARCRTADPNIFAVGDCTSHPSEIYGRRLRLESVHNALEQAKTAATNALGGNLVYSEVPWFWSDQYDLKLQIAGLSQGYDQVVIRGEPAERSFACLYLSAGKLIAIDAINAPRDFMQAKPLIAAGLHPEISSLENRDVALKNLGCSA